ncbi:TauD/TfdA family dioxygenase [Kitasatospora xanthocidica]|uniref:TauD/TfdA family dioxygenase n=1 Tax=Kitasatospora xanthocidica TaxID=83382 RepID=UPI0016746A31|nr:TauD/TfdA family dioxygenase [Kitasatospora xanthocidica]
MSFEPRSYPPTIRRKSPVPGSPLEAAAWLAEHRSEIEQLLHAHGVLLLRGFGITDADAFESVASALVATLYGEYGDLPHEENAGSVYKSTPYPANQSILFHHESSHMPHWPRRQFFCCVEPSPQGGATPIVDGRAVYAALPPEARDRFERVGIRYVRNFIEGLDVGWQTMFGTFDRSEVEARCAAQGIDCTWLPDGSLRTEQWAPAVVRHPTTGEPVFFNQLFLHHTACLEPAVREVMASLFGEDETAFPRSAAYGDGEPIPDALVTELLGLYDALAQRFRWERGDVAVIDNMLVAHGRDPFAGNRKILVAMGDMVARSDASPAPAR